MRYLRTTQAAEFFGVHPQTLRKWAKAGYIQVKRVSIRASVYDVDSYMIDPPKPKAKPKPRKTGQEVALMQLPATVAFQQWADFVEHRTAMGAPMTELASKKMIAKLERLEREGQDVNALLDNAVANGWKSVYPDKDSKTASKRLGVDSMDWNTDGVI